MTKLTLELAHLMASTAGRQDWALARLGAGGFPTIAMQRRPFGRDYF